MHAIALVLAMPLPHSTPTSSDVGRLAWGTHVSTRLTVLEFEQQPWKPPTVTIGVSQGGIACHLSQRSTAIVLFFALT